MDTSDAQPHPDRKGMLGLSRQDRHSIKVAVLGNLITAVVLGTALAMASVGTSVWMAGLFVVAGLLVLGLAQIIVPTPESANLTGLLLMVGTLSVTIGALTIVGLVVGVGSG